MTVSTEVDEGAFRRRLEEVHKKSRSSDRVVGDQTASTRDCFQGGRKRSITD